MNTEKILGYGLIGVSVLHLALGTNDPLNSLWGAITGSLEVILLLLGVMMVFFSGTVKRIFA